VAHGTPPGFFLPAADSSFYHRLGHNSSPVLPTISATFEAIILPPIGMQPVVRFPDDQHRLRLRSGFCG
jgi:hypothetical protein